jgi:hypothetical protein
MGASIGAEAERGLTAVMQRRQARPDVPIVFFSIQRDDATMAAWPHRAATARDPPAGAYR